MEEKNIITATLVDKKLLLDTVARGATESELNTIINEIKILCK